MKLIVCLMGLGTLLLAGAGCESDDHREHHNRGGVYDESYRGSGRGDFDRDRDRSWEERNWIHRDNRY
jgi:hypothetical protein